MNEENKDSRLSFRITSTASDSIDKAVEENNDIRNRSDFGEKAVEYYLAHLKMRTTREELVSKILVKFGQNFEKLIDGYDITHDEDLIKLMTGDFS